VFAYLWSWGENSQITCSLLLASLCLLHLKKEWIIKYGLREKVLFLENNSLLEKYWHTMNCTYSVCTIWSVWTYPDIHETAMTIPSFPVPFCGFCLFAFLGVYGQYT
jgi:hypothetical protein